MSITAGQEAPPGEHVSFLELEVTGFCQLKCKHCYADSGPQGDHGSMCVQDWERVVDEASALHVDTVQLIGGEPTLHPGLPRLVHHALGSGLSVDVYTNLVHVTPELWDLFSLPGVSLGTSWYSADPNLQPRLPAHPVATPGPEPTSPKRYVAASESEPESSRC